MDGDSALHASEKKGDARPFRGKVVFSRKEKFPTRSPWKCLSSRCVALRGRDRRQAPPLPNASAVCFFFFPRSSCSQRGKKVLMMSLQKCWTTFRPLADSQRWVHRGVNGCGRNGQSASQPPVRPRPLSRQRRPPLATARPHPIVSSWINALARKADPRNKNS